MAVAGAAGRLLRKIVGSLKQERGIIRGAGLNSAAARKSTRGRIDAFNKSQGARRQTLTGATEEMVVGVMNYQAGAAAGMTMGHQITKLAGIGITATALNAGISGYQDTFGDRMSGFGNFMAGVGKFGVTAAAGITGVTAIGRTAILASGRFGSKGAGAAAVNNIRNRIKSTAPGADDMAMLRSTSGARTQLKTGRGQGGQSWRGRLRRGEKLAGNLRMKYGWGARPHRPPSHGVPQIENLRPALTRHEQTVGAARDATSVMSLGKSAKHALKTEKSLTKSANLAERRLVKHESHIKQSYAMKTASNFNTMKSLVGPVLKLPGMMAGAMVGRGSIWGKIDPAMTYMGGAMAGGTISGLAAGAAVGMTSLKRGNLRNTQTARPRPQGRSFSNISYNATLHSHRMNM